MSTLLVQHSYRGGYATDLSGHRNHGYPFEVETGATTADGGFSFVSPDSRVVVPPSQSLEQFRGITVSCRAALAADAPERRLNLVEGHLTLALFVNPDRSISGTIVDQSGDWVGATTSAGAVPDTQPHEYLLRHDGLTDLQIYLDGALLAQRSDVAGPVRGIGEHGLVIGHWPEDSGEYTFTGVISEVELWTQNPVTDWKRALDPCCTDLKALEPLFQQWLKEAGGPDGLRKQFLELVDAAMAMTTTLRMADKTGGGRGYEWLAVKAILTGRRDLMVNAVSGLLGERTQGAAAEAAARAFQDLIDTSPFTQEQLELAAKALCLDGILATGKDS